MDRMHRARGFVMVGYHFVIKRDGTIEPGRPVNTIGAHVEGLNYRSVGVCLIGGVKEDGITAEANFTPAQYEALDHQLVVLRNLYPKTKIVGHRDLSKDLNGDGRITSNEWSKQCPCFDVATFVKSRGMAPSA